MRKGSWIIFCLLIINFNLFAQERADESVISLHEKLERKLVLGLNFLEKTQRTETKPGHSYRGEWPTYMCLRKGFVYLGTKNKVDDSNCFSVASIHNSLASIYLLYPKYESIPGMLDLSFEKIMTYRNGNEFNFWNLLPPNIKLKRGAKIGEQPLVRRPTNYKLTTKYINNAANVVEDADDTGLAYTAIALRKEYKKELSDSFSVAVNSIASLFEKYRDINRNNRHWYNYLNGNDHETGAYLTWLSEEYQFKDWSIAKVVGHNATFYLPFSECYPQPYVPYLPYGSNDVDGVVNANILSALSYYDELNSAGVDSAVRFIEKKCKREKYDRAGIYYPNRYHFPYAVSKAYANGVKKLKKSTDYILDYLLEKQNEDGSWSARKIVNKKDKLQSTAYAINAMIYIGKFEEEEIAAIESALNYIFANSISDERGVHWEGGVFFSGGTVIRNTLWWKSDAYTTAIILTALANYKVYLERRYEITNLNN